MTDEPRLGILLADEDIKDVVIHVNKDFFSIRGKIDYEGDTYIVELNNGSHYRTGFDYDVNKTFTLSDIDVYAENVLIYLDE